MADVPAGGGFGTAAQFVLNLPKWFDKSKPQTPQQSYNLNQAILDSAERNRTEELYPWLLRQAEAAVASAIAKGATPRPGATPVRSTPSPVPQPVPPPPDFGGVRLPGSIYDIIGDPEGAPRPRPRPTRPRRPTRRPRKPQKPRRPYRRPKPPAPDFPIPGRIPGGLKRRGLIGVVWEILRKGPRRRFSDGPKIGRPGPPDEPPEPPQMEPEGPRELPDDDVNPDRDYPNQEPDQERTRPEPEPGPVRRKADDPITDDDTYEAVYEGEDNELTPEEEAALELEEEMGGPIPERPPIGLPVPRVPLPRLPVPAPSPRPVPAPRPSLPPWLELPTLRELATDILRIRDLRRARAPGRQVAPPVPELAPGPSPGAFLQPLTSSNAQRAECEARCREAARRGKRKRKQRAVCYSGTFTETRRGTIKRRRRKVPCK